MWLIDPKPIYDMMENNKMRHGFVELHASDLDKLPRVDAVEVVRCRDCKFSTSPYIKGFRNCFLISKKVADNFFCAHGEKMDAEVTDDQT